MLVENFGQTGSERFFSLKLDSVSRSENPPHKHAKRELKASELFSLAKTLRWYQVDSVFLLDGN